MSLYTAAVLAKLPQAAHNGPVAQMCRRDPDTPARAALVDKWVDRFNPPKTCIKGLTSADSTSFWSAFW